MNKNNKSQDKSNLKYQLNQHVSVNMGHNYCIVSCSKHRLPDLVDTIDKMISKRWQITSGLTSDDGLVFQTLTKSTNV